jgi:hypothetical protein
MYTVEVCDKFGKRLKTLSLDPGSNFASNGGKPMMKDPYDDAMGRLRVARANMVVALETHSRLRLDQLRPVVPNYPTAVELGEILDKLDKLLKAADPLSVHLQPRK